MIEFLGFELSKKLSNLQKNIYHHIDSIIGHWTISQAEIYRSELYTQDESLSFKKKNNQTLPPNAVLTQKCKEYLLAVKSEILLKENPVIKLECARPSV